VEDGTYLPRHKALKGGTHLPQQWDSRTTTWWFTCKCFCDSVIVTFLISCRDVESTPIQRNVTTESVSGPQTGSILTVKLSATAVSRCQLVKRSAICMIEPTRAGPVAAGTPWTAWLMYVCCRDTTGSGWRIFLHKKSANCANTTATSYSVEW
jgi:hypothetical protein